MYDGGLCPSVIAGEALRFMRLRCLCAMKTGDDLIIYL